MEITTQYSCCYLLRQFRKPVAFMEMQKVAENELGGFTPFHSAIVTSFHTYPYQSEIYEYHYLYSNRRN